MVAINANNLSLSYRLRGGGFTGAREMLARLSAPSSPDRPIDALRNVSFALKAGDRLGLVGNNGAGKTTLLKVLYGIYAPSAGMLVVEGRPDALFNINLGFRREATGRRNIVLRGLINGWTRQQIAARMDEIIAFSELGEFIDMPFKAYSQGMAARLAFAIATSCNPDILLMDEWIGAGDPAFQNKSRQRLQELADRAGIVVLASHNHALLKKACNMILELDKGSVAAFEPADRWFARRSPGAEASQAQAIKVMAGRR